MSYGKKLAFIVSFILIVIPIVVFILSKISYQNRETIDSSIKQIVQEIDGPKQNKLGQISKKFFLNHDGEYAVFIKNLKNNESYVLNGDRKFDSASLYKLWIMAVAFQKIKDGKLNEEDVLSLPLDYLDSTLSTTTPTPTPEDQLPTPTPTPGEPKIISMKAGDAIEKMITISDNYSALLVASRSGNSSITDFLKQNGFTGSNYKQPPQTTAKDIGSFFEKLYKGRIVDEEYSMEMIDLLKKQTLNDRITRYLPEEIPVAHKTGELFNSKHDAGIVFTKKGDYIIVVLSDTKDPAGASEKIANFSKEIYDYFNN